MKERLQLNDRNSNLKGSYSLDFPEIKISTILFPLDHNNYLRKNQNAEL